jgi:AcrR family transcriptional regulator
MPNDTKTRAKRDPAATKERILKAGLAEFGAKGYGGARTAAIAKRAKCNIRMLYHYFNGKEGLYLACLARVYNHIRAQERALNLADLDPVEAIVRLVEFTFDHMRDNKDFVKLAGIENTLRGRFLKKLAPLPSAALELVTTIEQILAKGRAAGKFREDVDAVQLYISILSLSYLHLSNRHTLAITYGLDLGNPTWLKDRRDHVTKMVVSYLCSVDP